MGFDMGWENEKNPLHKAWEEIETLEEKILELEQEIQDLKNGVIL